YLHRQAAGFGSEQENVTSQEPRPVQPLGCARSERKHPLGPQGLQASDEVSVDLDGRVLVVVEPGPLQLPVVQPEAKGLDQMEPAAGVGAQTNDVAGVGRYLRLEQDDVEHFLLQKLTGNISLGNSISCNINLK